MAETDLQLGGGYIYQWECAILLALNYFFEPLRYNPTLFDLVSDFLGQVDEIHLEGEDGESGLFPGRDSSAPIGGYAVPRWPSGVRMSSISKWKTPGAVGKPGAFRRGE